MFQQYPQKDVNEPVLLHEGRFRVRAGDRCIESSGSAHLRWLPSPGIEFDIETDEPVGIDLDSLTVELPGFRTKKVVALSTHWGSTPSGRTSIRAYAGEMEWGGKQSLLSAGFQIVNFPDVITPGPSAVPGDPTAIAGDFGTIQTVALNHDGWQFRIVAVPGSGDRREQLKATGGYAFTHVGQLTRVDDSAFSVEQAKDILESLRQFLWFARGAACALPIHWGRGEDDEIVWRRFQSPIVDPWPRSHLAWMGKGLHTGEILAALFDPFCGIHKDRKLREPLGVALHWYRHCNTQSSGPEGSLVLGMAALDLLGAAHRRGSQWVDVSRAIRRPPWSREAAKAAGGAEAPAGHPAEVRSAEQVRQEQQLGLLPSAGGAQERIRSRERRETQDRVRVGWQGGNPRRIAVVTLVSGVGAAPLAGISRKLLQPDDGDVGWASRARTVE